jgi:hypothetical protein
LKKKERLLTELYQPLLNDLNALKKMSESYVSHFDKEIKKCIESLPFSSQLFFHLGCKTTLSANIKPIDKKFVLAKPDGQLIRIDYASVINYKQPDGNPLPNKLLLDKLIPSVSLLEEITTTQQSFAQHAITAETVLSFLQTIQSKTEETHEFKKTLSAHRNGFNRWFKTHEKRSAGGEFIADLKSICDEYPAAVTQTNSLTLSS